jgi:arylsulfatase A-like enzyme
MEGVRADSLGCYGSSRELTPNLDELAASGVRFEWAFAQSPAGPPSVAAVLTGLYATTHGLVEPGDRLVDEAPTLAESLTAAGWKTAAFFDGAGGEPGFSQGFDNFEVVSDASAAAASWMKENHSKRFFVLAVCHAPKVSADEMNVESVVEAYESRVRRFDKAAGQIMSLLHETGLQDDAAVLVLAATGRDLGEHPGADSVIPYATVTRVPLLLRQPGSESATVISEYVEIVDVMPTVLELAEVDEPQGVQGASLLALLDGTARPPYVAFGESATERYAALAGYGLVVTAENGAQLFDLSQDPLQLMDIAAQEEHRVAVLLDHLDAWGKMVAAASLDPERRIDTVDEETLEKLRSLGYIQ